MNKIRKLAIKVLKKWFASNDWEEIGVIMCDFCLDADDAWSYDVGKHIMASSCGYCVAPKVLCGKGHDSLFGAVDGYYTVSDDEFYVKKGIRYMRIGIVFLILFGKLPKRFEKFILKYVAKLNKESSEIDF